MADTSSTSSPIKGVGTGGRLSVRSLDRLEVTTLPGITSARSPFLSPDSRWIGFFDGTDLKKVSIDGGAPITLCTFSAAPRGASWDDDGTVVFATGDPLTGLWRVPAMVGRRSL